MTYLFALITIVFSYDSNYHFIIFTLQQTNLPGNMIAVDIQKLYDPCDKHTQTTKHTSPQMSTKLTGITAVEWPDY